MSTPSVSIIIPTYNHRDYVLATLESVFAQTWTDYEVIVVNDGSPDDTAARLQPLVAAGRIRYIAQANAGQAAARNRGLAEAKGTYVAFLDDDDLWPPDKLAWQVAALDEHPDWIMVTGLSGLVENDDSPREPARATGAVRMLALETVFEGNPIDSPGQTLIRRAILDRTGGFDPAIWGSDDLDLWIRLAAQGPVAMIGRCALYYRLHAANASRAVNRMFWSAVRAVRKNLPLLPRDRRGPVWREALRGVYVYSGTKVVCAARGCRPGAVRDALRVLAYLAVPMLRDAVLARMVGRDLLPPAVRRALRMGGPVPAK